MRICLVHRHLQTAARGILGTLYAGLAVRLRDAGHDVCVVTQDGEHPLDLPDVHRSVVPRTVNLYDYRSAVADLVRAWRPDVVDSALRDAEILQYALQPRGERAATVVRGVSAVRTGDDALADPVSAVEMVDAEHRLVLAADRLCAVSDVAAQDLARAYDIPLPQVILPGVDRARFHPGTARPPLTGYRVTLDSHGHVQDRVPLSALAAEGELPPPWGPADRLHRVLWMGTIDPDLGWDRLEHLAAELRGRLHLVVLLGGERPRCRVNLTDTSDVTMLRDLDGDDLISAYRASDWLLRTGRQPGLSLATAEALACGTPLLLPTDMPGSENLVARDGFRYGSTAELADLLTRQRPHASLTGLRWEDTVAASLEIYYSLIHRLTAKS